MSSKFGSPSYPLQDREPDFKIKKSENGEIRTVSYWVINIENTKTFELLYAYNNGNFDRALGKIEVKNSKGRYRFNPDSHSIALKDAHLSEALDKMKEYIDGEFEKEVLCL